MLPGNSTKLIAALQYGVPILQESARVWAVLLLGITLAGGGAGAAVLQRPIATAAESPAVRPQFDVASVREDPPSALRHVIQSPIGNRFRTTTASVRLLIQYAYGVQTFEIFGGPDWMNTIGYDVDARAVGNPTGSEMRLMLQSLLEDRFRLKFHRETKEVSVYRLVAAKSGIKLPKPKEGNCTYLGGVSSVRNNNRSSVPVAMPFLWEVRLAWRFTEGK
jgi:hypothetical protein